MHSSHVIWNVHRKNVAWHRTPAITSAIVWARQDATHVMWTNSYTLDFTSYMSKDTRCGYMSVMVPVPFHGSFWSFLNHPISTLPTPFLRSMGSSNPSFLGTCHSHLGNPISWVSCGKFLFPTHLNKKLLSRCALNCLQTLPTPLLGTMNEKPKPLFIIRFDPS